MPDVELELTQEEINSIVMVFIHTRLRPESRSVFKEHEGDIKEALYKAVFNDSCVDCIEYAIEYEENKAAENDQK